MSTTSLTAAEVMDRAAILQNDPDKTDYTYAVLLPYLNMAIDELIEQLEESNSSPTNQTSVVVTLTVGKNKLSPIEAVEGPYYPPDLVEIQSVGERDAGDLTAAFIPLSRREFLQEFPANRALMYWCWEDQCIKFNPAGATSPRDVQLQYVRQAIAQAIAPESVIGAINSKSYLSYKTAALCSMFIGENETRAGVLEAQAEKAIERLTGINNKGRQQMTTRRRPFRAGWKARGY